MARKTTLRKKLPRRKTAEPTISLNLIAKDEEGFIEDCLRSVSGVVDEVVVVDTGSSDGTPRIARSLGAQVYPFEWCDDFAAARNHGLKHCRGDWILTLDADEALDPKTKNEIRRSIARRKVDLWYLRVLNLFPDGSPGGKSGSEVRLARLYRRVPGMRYVGRIHEQLDHNLPAAIAGHSKARIFHRGYDPEVMLAKGKQARNTRLLELALQESIDGPPILRSSYLHYWAMAAQGVERLQRFQAFAEYVEQHPELYAKRVAWVPSGLLHYAVALRNAQRPREAAEVAEQLLQRFGEAPYLHALVAAGALAEGRLGVAAAEIEKALAVDAPLDDSHLEYVVPREIATDLPRLVQAQLDEQRQRWPRAEEAYRALLSHHESARPRLAYVQLVQGRYRDALATLDKSPKRNGQAPPELSCLAFVLSLIAESSDGLLWWGERVRANAAHHSLSAAVLHRVENWTVGKPFQFEDFPELAESLRQPAPN